MVRCLPCVEADAWSTFSASVARFKAPGAKLVGRKNSFSKHVQAIKDQLRAEKQQRPKPTDEHPSGTGVDEVSLEEKPLHGDPAAPGSEWLNTVAALKEKLCSAHGQRTQLLEELEAQTQRIQELEARGSESPDHQHIFHLEEQVAIYKERITMLEANTNVQLGAAQKEEVAAPGSAQRVLELEQELLRMQEHHAQVGELEAMSAAESAFHADQIAELEATIHGHAQRSAQLEIIAAELRQAEESYIRRIKELEETAAANQGPHGNQADQRCLELEGVAASHAHRCAELEALVEDLRRREEASAARIQQLQEEAAGHSNSSAPEMEAMLGTYEKRIIELEAENQTVKSAAANQEEHLTRQIAQAIGERNAQMEALVGEMKFETLNHAAQTERDQHAAKQHDLQQSSSEAQRASELEATIANMANAEQAHRDRISKLEDNIATQQSSYGAQLADMEVAHQTRVGELEARSSEMRQRHQEALMQISQLEDDLAHRSGQHAGQLAQLEEKSRTSTQRAADLEAQIADMKEAHASDIDRLQAEVTSSQGHRVQVELLQSELADMEGHRVQLQRLQEELAAAQGHRAQVERLQAELAAMQAAAGTAAGAATGSVVTGSVERSESQQPPFPLTPKDAPTASIVQVLTPKESQKPVGSMQTQALNHHMPAEPTTWQSSSMVVQLQPPGGYTSNGGGPNSGRGSSTIRRVPSGSRNAAIEAAGSCEIRGPPTPTNYSTTSPSNNYSGLQTEVLAQPTRWVPGAPPQVNLTKPTKLGSVQPLDRTRIRGAAVSGPPSLVPVPAQAARMPQLHSQAPQASRVPRRSGHWQQ